MRSSSPTLRRKLHSNRSLANGDAPSERLWFSTVTRFPPAELAYHPVIDPTMQQQPACRSDRRGKVMQLIGREVASTERDLVVGPRTDEGISVAVNRTIQDGAAIDFAVGGKVCATAGEPQTKGNA